MKTKYALPMVLAGSVVLSGCWLDDDDDPATTSVRVLHASSDAPADFLLLRRCMKTSVAQSPQRNDRMRRKASSCVYTSAYLRKNYLFG